MTSDPSVLCLLRSQLWWGAGGCCLPTHHKLPGGTLGQAICFLTCAEGMTIPICWFSSGFRMIITTGASVRFYEGHRQRPSSWKLCCQASTDTLPALSSAQQVWSGLVMWTTTGTCGHPRCVMVPVARQQGSAQVLCLGVSSPLTGLLFPGCGAVCTASSLSSIQPGREEMASCALGTP